MNAPTIHGRYRSVPASEMLAKLGDAIGRIKDRDRLTYVDVGRVLGKSDDQAGKYREGSADMGFVSFCLGVREWDGSFANDALALVGMKIVPLEAAEAADRDMLPALTALLHEVAVALADDGRIDEAELAKMRPQLEVAGRALDVLRERLRLRAVA